MINFYRNLTRTSDYIVDLCYNLLRLSDIGITKTTLSKALHEHPDYPSMLTLGDVLKKFNIPSIAARLKVEKLKRIPFPYLASIKGETAANDYFSLVKHQSDAYVTLTTKERSTRKISWDEFETIYGGVAFLIEKDEKSGEDEFKKKKFQESVKTVALDVCLLAIPMLILLNISMLIYQRQNATWIIYEFLSLTGWCIALLILWLEVDKGNKALKKVCGLAQQTSSCTTVFQSSAGKVAGFSWGNIGFAFFSFLLYVQAFSNLKATSIEPPLQVATILAVFYAPFSIYYQKYVVKQWCRLCLLTQLVLIIQFVMVVYGSASYHFVTLLEDSYNLLVAIIFGGLIPLLLSRHVVDLLKEKKELTQSYRDLNKARFSSSLFYSLLKTQKEIQHNPEGLGIMLGNPNAKHKIIKVCNPYCGPCALVHKTVEGIIDNDRFSLQIIFTASPDVDDIAAKPVRHFLDVANQGDEKLTLKALHDWYSDPVKDYNKFSMDHPAKGDLYLQNNKIEQMWDWCNKTQISFTPTFFIDGYQLPENYSIEEVEILLGAK